MDLKKKGSDDLLTVRNSFQKHTHSSSEWTEKDVLQKEQADILR